MGKKNDLINDVCKNKELVPDKDIQGQFVNIGCKNLRANGSSRCSECSKKHAK